MANAEQRVNSAKEDKNYCKMWYLC